MFIKKSNLLWNLLIFTLVSLRWFEFTKVKYIANWEAKCQIDVNKKLFNQFISVLRFIYKPNILLPLKLDDFFLYEMQHWAEIG